MEYPIKPQKKEQLDISFLSPPQKGGLDISFLAPPSEINPPKRILNFLGNKAKYLGDLFKSGEERVRDLIQTANDLTTEDMKYIPEITLEMLQIKGIRKYTGDQVKAINDRIDHTADQMANWIMSSSWPEFVKDIASTAVSPVKHVFQGAKQIYEEGAIETTKNVGQSLVNIAFLPIEVMTNTTEINGKAVPLTPEMHTDKLLETVGTVAMFATASGMSRVMLPQLGTKEAMAYAKKKTLSRYGETIAKDAFIGSVAGGVQAGIAQIGQEDYVDKIIGTSLTMLPVGVLFGSFQAIARNRQATRIVKDQTTRLSFTAAYDAAGDALATNGLKIDGSDTIMEALSNIDSFATADNIIDMLIHSRVDIGKGVVIPGVSAAKLTELQKLQYLDGKNHIVGPDGTVFIKPKELEILPSHKEMFEKTGFFPNEIVTTADGSTFRVNGFAEDKGNPIDLRKAHDRKELVFLLNKSADELDVLASEAKASDNKILETLFGIEGAKKYIKLTRRAEAYPTVSDAVANEASKQLEAMEATLTEAQLKLLHNGSGERLTKDYTELREIANAARDYSPNNLSAQTVRQLQNILGRELAVGKPTTDVVSAIRLRGAATELQRRSGKPLEAEIQTAINKRIAGGYLTKEQAGELFVYTMFQLKQEGVFNPALLNAPKGPKKYTSDMVLVGISNKGTEHIVTPSNLSSIRRTGNAFDTQIFKSFSSADGQYLTTVSWNTKHGAPTWKDSGTLAGLTKTGNVEGIYRVTTFAMGPKTNRPSAFGHQDFATLEEAVAYAESGNVPSELPGLGSIRPRGGMHERSTKTQPGTVSRKGVTELTPEAYFDIMYEQFKHQGFDAVNGTGSFSDLYYKFVSDMGITSKSDQVSLLNSFYQKIQKDLLAAVDEPTRKMFNETSTRMEIMAQSIREDAALSFYNAASTNGMYIIPRGAGRYDIKFVDSGETFKTVGSAEEGLAAIGSEFGEMKGMPVLDGGNGQSIPPAAMSPGGNMSVPISTFGNPTTLDFMNTIAFGINLTPIIRQLGSFDEIYGTKLVPLIGEPLQRALENVKNLMNGEGKHISKAANDIITYGRKHKLTLAERETVQNAIEVRSIDELEFGQTNVVKDYALAVSKLDSPDKLIDYMFEVRTKARDAIPGSAKFERIKESVSKSVDKDGSLRYDDQVVGWADSLWTNPIFKGESVPSILRLAQAYKNPAQAMTRAAYEARYYTRTFEQNGLAGIIEDGQRKAAEKFGVPFRPVNEIKPYIGGGGDPLFDTPQSLALMAEQAEMGYIARNQLSRDPGELFTSYIMAGFRTLPRISESLAFARSASSMEGGQKLISSRDVFERVKAEKMEAMQVLLKDIEPGKRVEIENNIKSVVSQHMLDTRGVPRLDARLSNSAQRIWQKQFGIDSRSAIAWTTVAFMGGRAVFALRDITSTASNIFSNHGLDFIRRVMQSTITGADAKVLIKEGVVPNPSGLDFILPSEDMMIGYSRLHKMSNMAFKLSGQHIVYTRFAAGIYRVTRDDFAKYGNIYQSSTKDAVARAKFIDEMDLDLVPKSVVDDIFLRLDSPGNGVSTGADVLGRWRVRTNLNIFGNHNTPLAWQGRAGRVLGHMGSWGSNQAQTLNDMWNRGAGVKRAGRIMRYTASQATILTVGYAAGLNLYNWIIEPLGLFGVGPIVTTLGKAAFNARQALFSGDEQQRSNASRLVERMSPAKFDWEGRSIPEILQLDQAYIPYGAAANDWLKAIDVLNKGYGAGQALFRGVGGQLDQSHQSPLQQLMGNEPVGKDGYPLPARPIIPFTQP